MYYCDYCYAVSILATFSLLFAILLTFFSIHKCLYQGTVEFKLLGSTMHDFGKGLTSANLILLSSPSLRSFIKNCTNQFVELFPNLVAALRDPTVLAIRVPVGTTRYTPTGYMVRMVRSGFARRQENPRIVPVQGSSVDTGNQNLRGLELSLF